MTLNFLKVLENGTKISINQEEVEIPYLAVTPRWNPSIPPLTNHQKEKDSRSAGVEKQEVERSSSSSKAKRLHLADDVWVTEKSEDKLCQEKQKARQELELVKQARLETLEPERHSSRMGELSRQEASEELQEIKKVRSTMIENTKEHSEVSNIMLMYHNQYS